MASNEFIVVTDADAVARKAAEMTVAIAKKAVADTGKFTFVLSGGSTPERLYKLLAQVPYSEEMPWQQTFVFEGDERFVPESASVNNFGMARRTLLEQVPIPQENLFPIPTDGGTPAEAAAVYAETLREFFGSKESIVFDLILLGLGDDGHTASLFPGKPALAVTDASVTYSEPGVLPPPVDRVTLTFPVINAGRNVLFLITGEKKAEKLALIRAGKVGVEEAPAVGVQPVNGVLTFLVDAAAANQ